MSQLQKINVKIDKLKNIFSKIHFNKVRYRYCLVDVEVDTSGNIVLSVLITGIKKEIICYNPENVVRDDTLLSEFSSCDVRAITYLSFHKYIKSEIFTLKIVGQIIDQGMTLFKILDLNTNHEEEIDAKCLYQNHDLLSCLSKKDMITVISTAVQQQTISDMKKMEVT